MTGSYQKHPNHHYGRRKAEGTHASPEYTANGPGIAAASREWPSSDKFLAYMRQHEKPRFEDITRAESRRVLLRLVK